MPAGLYPLLSCLDNDTAVHLQARHCSSTGCRYADDLCPICLPMKMPVPLLLTWIEERHLGIGLWVNTCLMIAFERVTRDTGEAKIFSVYETTRRFRHNMIDLHLDHNGL